MFWLADYFLTLNDRVSEIVSQAMRIFDHDDDTGIEFNPDMQLFALKE
ncbi:hypothetical protein ABKU31_21315 (plasmid) [Enterobacter asburiae]